jgi:hypothetical protein
MIACTQYSILLLYRFGAERKAMATISGILVGTGEILGGGLFGILGRQVTDKLGRWSVVLLGCTVSLLAYGLIFLNIPNEAPLGETEASAFIGMVKRGFIY